MTLALVTVTGTMIDGSTAPMGAQVQFTPTSDLTDLAGEHYISGTPVIAVPDQYTGQFSAELIPTDSAGILPVGWLYTVTVTIGASSAWFVTGLPSSPSTVDITDLMPSGFTVRSGNAGVGPVAMPGIEYLPSTGGTSTGSLTLSGAPPLIVPGAASGQILVSDGAGNFTVQNASGGGAVSSVFTRTGAVTATSGDYAVAQVTGAAPLASPALTGSPTAPTQTPGDNTTKIATDAFVATAVAAFLPLAGGTMTGAIAMGSHKVTGLTNGSASGDAAAYGQTPAGGTTVTVVQGGTGDTSLTAYAPLAGGTTTTGALQQCTTGLSTSGYVLTSNGSSALPTFQAASGGGSSAAVQTATVTSTTVGLNASTYGAFLITLGGAGGSPTFTFSGGVAATEVSFTLYLIQDGTGSRTVTWPSSVKWQDAIAPTLTTTPAKTDILVFSSPDNGTTWYGSLAGLNY